MNNSPKALQVLGAVWAVVVWLPGSSWSPRAPPDDTSDRFSFPCERWVGNRVVFSGLPERWPWVVCRAADFHLLSIPTR